MATNQHIIGIDPVSGNNQSDSAGAGDAFLGGLMAVIYHFGMPQNASDLQWIGNIAKCVGVVSLEILGALPILTTDCTDSTPSADRLIELNADLRSLVDHNPIVPISDQ